jgi:hypothetical protein
MTHEQNLVEQNRIAEAVRQACVETALAAYEDAGINGLCHEGRWECAVGAMRSLNVAAIVEQYDIDLKRSFIVV